ncbi:2-amino-4-hydroxy-6-hydroxymethyldihydropteridine diphosphokinase [Macrococcoides canis]|uniref:2-amino-4-hydroxy-6-hydroxymethyldihydropteridine diphosphokinase n=1 Tax=Macrococcoides canis TaxID=1855823 RepID=A0A4R6C0Z4_9STAP|nr:2-amino-4-hydroxy-6-hydroxymethyldihydropteridine diphosphokinase [Macrococcus canis]MEE1108074.1 2-amino-4-hydroxy-6-hydroxymethyldihydropteridine diphosphokinase [Macrococcus canis]TDM14875.1 2-amino-4-hydroxy-6-hydroxymethyldihydropteridine diphosphokinase [Macrococcus canis]TDM19162.1 2-amino-4-hydroxy-6-hydroxymethyldihydropteridine diphosphokinase [Macrococcus canis]TDM21065.1 2-amino-4-hydroxy-6-hydroxymethyldihydropteridine diphosphokinase [Macrococcus canis]TDM29081.1 2-amino-4-hyd
MKVYISFGSNIGDREYQINEALRKLEQIQDTKLKAVSSLYETAPVGGVVQDDFLNGAAIVETNLTPISFLNEIQRIELELGRERKIHWGPRTIDLDVLLMDDVVIKHERLKVPHPFMHERSFVLIPLAEIAPEAVHPVLNKKIKELVTMDPEVRRYK